MVLLSKEALLVRLIHQDLFFFNLLSRLGRKESVEQKEREREG